MICIHPTATTPDALKALEIATGLRATIGKTFAVLSAKPAHIVISFSNINPASLGLPNIFGGAQ